MEMRFVILSLLNE